MGRIIVAVAVQVIALSVVTQPNSVGDLFAAIVQICAVAVHDLAKQPVPDQAGRQQFPLAVAAIFQEHKGSFCLLIGSDKLPAIFNAVGTAHFQSRNFAGLHAGNR